MWACFGEILWTQWIYLKYTKKGKENSHYVWKRWGERVEGAREKMRNGEKKRGRKGEQGREGGRKEGERERERAGWRGRDREFSHVQTEGFEAFDPDP